MVTFLGKGDIVEFDFNPSKGHEPAGRRPGLVVSSDEFNYSTFMTLVCPITARDSGFPLHLELPDSLQERYGFVVTEQIRAYDLQARHPEVVAHLDVEGEFMRDVDSLLKSYL